MAFVLPRDPLMPAHTLRAHIAPGQRIVRAADVAVWADAQALLESARHQADEIVAQAHTQLEAERQRGYEQGLAQARMEQVDKMIETVSQTIDYLAQVEGDMVNLVTTAVRKIVEGFDDHERVVMVVKSALTVVRNQKQMTLRLHPQQVDVVRSRTNELLSGFPGVGYLDIVADGRLTLDSCILESEIGLVEASVEGQIKAINAAFQKVLGSRV